MKKQILLSLFLHTFFCVAPVFAQSASSSEEKLVTVVVKLKNVPEDRISLDPCEKASSFRKIIKSVGMYLSPIGGIEIDARSRTLIITDNFKHRIYERSCYNLRLRRNIFAVRR